MKRALLFGAGTALSLGVSPVEKVLQMLSDMVSKGQQEMVAEADTFDKIEATVHKRLIDADISIKREKSQIEKYSAINQEAAATSEKLDNDISELESQNAAEQAAYDARKQERADTKAEFQKEHKDLSESVDALTRAVQTLKASQTTVATVALVQEDLKKTVPAVHSQLESLLQAAPVSNAYETQSGGIVQVLTNLLKDFKGQLADCQKAEANRQHAYEMFRLDVEDQIKSVNAEIDDMKENSAAQKARAGKAAQDRDAAAGALADGQKLKKDTQQYSAMNKAAFEGNQKYRKAELKALKEAVDIISGESVKGGSEKHFAKLVQTSFLQVRSSTLENTRRNEVLKRAREVIASVNTQMNKRSEALSLLSAQIMTGGPFDKVIGMVEDMIARLEQEKKDEGEHKAWCDKNLKETSTDKDDTQAAVDKLTAQLEGLNANKAQKQEDKAKLEAEVKQHHDDMKEATEERNEEKKENKATIADAQGAQQALEKAIGVLQSFYEGGAQLLQQDPVIKSYSGMGESNTGVVGMLETIESDFARLEADTTAMEAQKAAEYDRMMDDTKKNVADKKQRISDTKIDIINLNASINKTNKGLANKSKELKAILSYWDQLQPMCVVKQVSYEERVQQRNEEIASLKEAYEILSEEMSK